MKLACLKNTYVILYLFIFVILSILSLFILLILVYMIDRDCWYKKSFLNNDVKEISLKSLLELPDISCFNM